MAQPFVDVQKPYQIILEACSLIMISRPGLPAIDLRGAVRSIDVYESLLTSTISGVIELDDISGIVEACPVIGEEGLLLRFSRGNDQVYEGAFRIVKLSDREFVGEELQRFKLHFVSPELLVSLGTSICRAFKNVTASQAVKTILTKDIATTKTLFLDETKQPLTITIPNYAPFDAIQFFATRALSASNPPQANYLFWETLEGFHFQSMASMVTATPTITIQRQPGNLPVALSKNTITPERMYVREAFDVLRDMDQGLFASRIIAVDLIRQDYQVFDQRYRTGFTDRAHLDPYPVYTRSHTESANPQARVSVVSATNNLSAAASAVTQYDPTLRPGLWPNTLATRSTQLNELRRHTLMTEGPGHVLVRAGSVLNVRVPSMRQLADHATSAQDVAPVHYDKYYSGKHLVLACRHTIVNLTGKFEYRQSLELVKDSLATSLT